MEKVNLKYLAFAAAVFIAWFSWFFRYDLGSHSVVLDRWSGSLIINDNRTILSDVLTYEEKRARPTIVTPAPEAAMPVPEPPNTENQDQSVTRKGMFDDLEKRPP